MRPGSACSLISQRNGARLYKLRSYVWCVPCQRRMHGHSSRQGVAYAYCQPRNREIPQGHPAAIRVREDVLIDAATWFFNDRVLGPDRLTLIQASMPAAADVVRAEHEKTEQVLRRQIGEVSRSMDNLLRVLEHTQDPDGQFFARTGTRIAELETDLAGLEARLRRHLAAAPPERDDNTDLLTWLPHAEVDLNALAGDRLRRFLDAFRVEIHFDIRTGRAVFRAEISGEMIDHLTQQISRAEVERSVHARARRQRDAKEERDEGAQLIKGSSFRLCPRRVPYNKGTRRHRPKCDVRGGRRCVAAAAARPAVAVT